MAIGIWGGRYYQSDCRLEINDEKDVDDWYF